MIKSIPPTPDELVPSIVMFVQDDAVAHEDEHVA